LRSQAHPLKNIDIGNLPTLINKLSSLMWKVDFAKFPPLEPIVPRTHPLECGFQALFINAAIEGTDIMRTTDVA
jgi:hypothetical protein